MRRRIFNPAKYAEHFSRGGCKASYAETMLYHVITALSAFQKKKEMQAQNPSTAERSPSPPLSQPFFCAARKRQLEKREPAGETSRRVITECTRRSILFFICHRQRSSDFPVSGGRERGRDYSWSFLSTEVMAALQSASRPAAACSAVSLPFSRA